MKHCLKFTAMAALTSASLLASHTAAAQAYPSKPVHVMIPSTAGGATDILGRLLSQKLQDSLKQPFIVENRAGAGGTLAYAATAKVTPDGYTLLAAAPSFLWAKITQPDITFDPLKDLTPISQVTKTPLLIIVYPGFPVKSIKELIAYAKAKPGEITAGVNNGSNTHVVLAYFNSMAGIKMTYVPYKGAAQAVTDMVAGRVNLHLGAVSSNIARVRNGSLRALAVTTAERSPALPDVPTVIEAGLPGFEVNSWHGWLTTTGTPAANINKIYEELGKAVRSPELSKALEADGAVPFGNTPAEFQANINREGPNFIKVIKESGVKME